MEGYYDEKEQRKERLIEARVWIVFTIFAGLIFSYIVFLHAKDIILEFQGNKITVDYSEKSNHIVIKKDGQSKTIEVQGMIDSHGKDKIDIYYYGDDISDARPLTNVTFWVFGELFFGGIVIICIILARKILKVTEHSKHSYS